MMDTENPVVKLCVAGSAAEFAGKIDEAKTFYRQAWDGLDPLARKVLLAMPLVQRDGEPLDYLAKIAKLEVGQVRMALNKLVLLNLVDARGGVNKRRYTIHSLTSTFLQEQIAKWE